MNIDDLDSKDYTTVVSKPMNISDLDPSSYKVIAPPESSTSQKYAQGAVNSLPAVGGVMGGLLGTPADVVSGPMGTVAGAGIGGYLGTAAKNLINNYTGNAPSPSTVSGSVGSAVEGGLEQAGAQGIGESVISPVVNKGAEFVDKGYQAAKGLVQSGAAKMGQSITGMPKALTQNYMQNTDGINSLIKQWGDNTADFAQDVRQKWMNVVQNAKNSLYGVRDAAVSGAPTDTNIDVGPIIDKLEAAKNGLHPDVDAGAINEIDQHIWAVKQLSKKTSQGVSPPNYVTPDLSQIPPTVLKAPRPLPARIAQMRQAGEAASSANLNAANSAGFDPYNLQNPETYQTSVQGLHKIKGYLQGVAQSSYNSGGNIFNSAPAATNAAKGAGAVARRIFIDEAPQAASSAEAQLHSLHGIEESMNSNLLDPNAPFNSITQAGSNPGGTPAKTLKELGKVIPYDFLQDAKDFATAQSFRDAGLVPMDTTGKSVARQMLVRGPSAGLGWLAGKAVGAPEIGTWMGYNAGPMLASPAMMRSGINAANSITKPAYGLLKAAPSAASIMGPRVLNGGLLNGQ